VLGVGFRVFNSKTLKGTIIISVLGIGFRVLQLKDSKEIIFQFGIRTKLVIQRIGKNIV